MFGRLRSHPPRDDRESGCVRDYPLLSLWKKKALVVTALGPFPLGTVREYTFLRGHGGPRHDVLNVCPIISAL